MAKKRIKKSKSSKLEEMMMCHRPTSGLVKPPKGRSGPVVSIDIDQYMKEQESTQGRDGNSQIPLNAGLTDDLSVLRSIKEAPAVTGHHLERSEISRRVAQMNLSELESLWAYRLDNIRYREDACSVIAALRYLQGIDSSIQPHWQIAADHAELVADFEPLPLGENSRTPIPPIVPADDNIPTLMLDLPLTGDKRTREMIQTIRDGQGRFRECLIQHYGARCMVTGESVEAVIEAAHIRPYDGNKTNAIQNGLLLRIDIHRLFDKGLLAIEPETLKIYLHPSLHNTSYAGLEGKTLSLKASSLIDQKALQLRFLEVTSAICDSST